MDVKVNQVGMNNIPQVNKDKLNTKDPTFKFMLISKIEDNEFQLKLNGLMTKIQEQGNKITKHMDVKDMKQYRELVRTFLNEVVTRSHQFSRENFLDRRGRHRVYGIIKRVDKTLDELANALMEEQKNSLTILSKVDEIRGLLLDVIT